MSDEAQSDKKIPRKKAGRPKGSGPKAKWRKLNDELKDATPAEIIQAAFDELGGIESLVAWGQKHPKDFYALWNQVTKQRGAKPLATKSPSGGVTVKDFTSG